MGKAHIGDIVSLEETAGQPVTSGTAALNDIERFETDQSPPKDFLSRMVQGLNPLPAVKAIGSVPLSVLPGETGAAARQTLKDTLYSPIATGKEWMKEAKAGEYQGIAGDIAAFALPSALSKGSSLAAGKLSEHAYEKSLGIPKSTPMDVRAEMVKRGLDPDKPLPVSKQSMISVWRESQAIKKTVNYLTKDPKSPYSQRTVSVPDILGPVDDYIKDLQTVDPGKAKRIKQLRATWERSLTGYAPVKIYGPNQALLPPRTPPFATVAEAQRLKELMDRELSDAAFTDESKSQGVTRSMKAAGGKMKEAIEKAVPEEPIRRMNAAIQRDIYLKKAILGALKRNPGFLDNWAASLGTLGLEEIVAGRTELGVSAMVGAAVRLAMRNPKILSNLAVNLNRYSRSPVPSMLSTYPLLSVPANVESTPQEESRLK